ncbi:MAG: hypothetical protein GH149_04675 [Methanosarcinales archaeon]|nr:hypothetical protein [Methanosarcinales archaeon]
MEKIPTWIERLLLPKLNEIVGAIKALHSRIDSVEKTWGARQKRKLQASEPK